MPLNLALDPKSKVHEVRGATYGYAMTNVRIAMKPGGEAYKLNAFVLALPGTKDAWSVVRASYGARRRRSPCRCEIAGGGAELALCHPVGSSRNRLTFAFMAEPLDVRSLRAGGRLQTGRSNWPVELTRHAAGPRERGYLRARSSGTSVARGVTADDTLHIAASCRGCNL
jgi:hypothetical protein